MSSEGGSTGQKNTLTLTDLQLHTETCPNLIRRTIFEITLVDSVKIHDGFVYKHTDNAYQHKMLPRTLRTLFELKLHIWVSQNCS